ncbi:hypothetical protein [Flintibacter muris]|uniref:hypothetical protein n=1 Tax=Flintibacter muris TaxID=2941327 RepID=UPI00203BF0E9|nr:hypothetical protein [Flintibacter muris]
MTLDECREHLPDGWTQLIQQDPLLLEIFEEHEYDLEMEAVPPFLIQDLRDGNIEHLRPILALYGQPGLDMLRGLLEIDEASRDTATSTTSTGQTACAAYFFARFDPERKQAAIDAARTYIKAINRIYVEEFEEEPPLAEDGEIEFLSGQEGRDFEEQVRQMWITGEGIQTVDLDELNEWYRELEYRKGCEDIGLLSEALYHISCDYDLSCCLQWPMYDTQRENPFHGYFDLWKLGLHIHFPARDRVVLVD